MRPFLTIKVAVAWLKKHGCADACVLLKTADRGPVRVQVWRDGDDWMYLFPR